MFLENERVDWNYAVTFFREFSPKFHEKCRSQAYGLCCGKFVENAEADESERSPKLISPTLLCRSELVAHSPESAWGKFLRKSGALKLSWRPLSLRLWDAKKYLVCLSSPSRLLPENQQMDEICSDIALLPIRCRQKHLCLNENPKTHYREKMSLYAKI